MGKERTKILEKEEAAPARAEKSFASAKRPSRTASCDSPQGVSMAGTTSTADLPLTANNLLFLQRTVGNRAVGQLLQRKVMLSQPGDALEQEADQVADHVMRSSAPTATALVQRQIRFEGDPNGKQREAALTALATKIKQDIAGHTPKSAILNALREIDNEEEPCTSAEAEARVYVLLGIAKKPDKATKREGVAEQAKAEKIQPYLDLLDHLAGERSGKEVTGGHLLTAMQEAWGEELECQVVAGDQADTWTGEWRLGNGPWKRSTMFPATWTREQLEAELRGSYSEGATLVLPSGIRIQKKGDTFFPVHDE